MDDSDKLDGSQGELYDTGMYNTYVRVVIERDSLFFGGVIYVCTCILQLIYIHLHARNHIIQALMAKIEVCKNYHILPYNNW